MRFDRIDPSLETPSLGLAAGLGIGLVAVVLSRLTGVSTPAVLAAAVAVAWLGVVTVIVSRTLEGVDPDGHRVGKRFDAERQDGRAAGPTAAGTGSDTGTDANGRSDRLRRDSIPRPSVPAWIESDATPWRDRNDERELAGDTPAVSDSKRNATADNPETTDDSQEISGDEPVSPVADSDEDGSAADPAENEGPAAVESVDGEDAPDP